MRAVALLSTCLIAAANAFRTAPARHLYEEYTPIQWGLDRIDLFSSSIDGSFSYDFTGEGVRVYVADSGVDGLQYDFQSLNAGPSRVLSGTSTYPPTWIGLPGNTDEYDHGTDVASLVGGLQYGVAKAVTIIPVRVLDGTGSGSMQGLVNAINWIIADAKTAQSSRNIINLSIDAAFSFALDSVLKTADQSNFVVVGAAGNEQIDACQRSPGGSSYVISVGSTQLSNSGGDQISSFSNYGPCVSIFAPGSEIPGALANNGETQDIIMSGTSMASPVVAGVAALLWDKYPTWTASQISARLLKMAVQDSIDFTGCFNCSASTVNKMVQTPTANVVVVNNVDALFVQAAFGGSLSYWPRLSGNAVLVNEGCSSTVHGPLQASVAVLEWTQCSSSAYAAALSAQLAGAIAVLVVAKDCFSVSRISVAHSNGPNLVTIPVACVLPGTVAAGSVVQVGLVRQTFANGPAPWTYASIGSQALERMNEWRAVWTGSALGMQPGYLCVSFTPKVVAGLSSAAHVAVTLASTPVVGMTAQTSSYANVDAYTVRLGGAGGISIFANGASIATQQSSAFRFDGSTPLYLRVGYSSTASFIVDVGLVNESRSLLSVVDNSPKLGVNYFSFSSSGAVTVVLSGIDSCPASFLSSLFATAPERGGSSLAPSTSSSGGNFGFTGTASPTSHAPTSHWSAPLCNRIKKKAACYLRSQNACAWIGGKCLFVVSE